MTEASRSRYLYVAFWIGFSSLVYEVYSAKVLFLFFLETTHAVALTLSAFLAGLAFSSLYFSRRVGPANARAERLLVMLQLAAAVYALGILRQYFWIPKVVDAVTRTVGIVWATLSSWSSSGFTYFSRASSSAVLFRS